MKRDLTEAAGHLEAAQALLAKSGNGKLAVVVAELRAAVALILVGDRHAG